MRTRKTTAKAVIKLFDTTAKYDGEYVANTIQSFCDLQYLDAESYFPEKWATLEDRGFLLDGSQKIMTGSEDPSKFSIWSLQMSDEQGYFSVNPQISRTFAHYHSVAGLNIKFDKNYPLPKKIKIRFEDEYGRVLNEKTFNVNKYIQFFSIKTDLFKKCVIECVQTESYQYARIKGVDYGQMIEYSTDSDKYLIGANLLEELDVTSSQLSINTSSIKVVDNNEQFSINNPEGYYSLLQQRQKIELYENIDGVEYIMATHYLRSWETTSGAISTFNCQDVIGLMDSLEFEGGVYENVPAGDIIDSLMASFKWEDYFVDEDVRSIRLSGILKPMSLRAALQQVAFATRAVVDTSRISGINIYHLSHTTQTIIGKDRKLMSPEHKVIQTDLITDVLVNAHSYKISDKVKEAYKDDLDSGTYAIKFKEPFESIQASGCQLLASTQFGAKIKVTVPGEVKITGLPYEDNVTVYRVSMEELPPGMQRKTKKIEKATLVSKSNAEAIAKHLYDIYQYRLSHSFKILTGDEKVGNFSAVTCQSGMAAVVLESMSTDLAGGFLSTCSGIGYQLSLESDVSYAGNELYANDQIGVI